MSFSEKEYQKRYRDKNKDKIKERRGDYHKKWYLKNKDRVKRNVESWRSNNSEKVKGYSRNNKFKKYGIDKTKYDDLLNKQSGLCAICLKPEMGKNGSGKIECLSIDHNHMSGTVRGLLCGDCNRGLGLFKDNPIALRMAAKYLEDNDAF